MTRKVSFSAIIQRDARILILGSLPGEASLAAAQYYAHPRNHFWRLIGAVVGDDLAGLTYTERLAALTRHRVGLWDAVATAQRRGSLDSAIREPVANQLRSLVLAQADLRVVACNGQTAARIATRELAGSGVPVIALPSSSPAHAAMPWSEKERRWLELRKFL
ncbi:MAG: DNA-deoxyinosine glycosylase [Alteraurantiacibacter sp.]